MDMHNREQQLTEEQDKEFAAWKEEMGWNIEEEQSGPKIFVESWSREQDEWMLNKYLEAMEHSEFLTTQEQAYLLQEIKNIKESLNV